MSVLFVGLASSCNDAIDIVQDGELGNDVTFQTVDDLQQFLGGAVYTNLTTSPEIGFTTVFTDEIGIGPSNGGQGVELFRFNLNAASGGPSTIWLTHYRLINRVNRLLDGAELVTPVVDVDAGIDETAQYNDILAQARALRAYSYVQLVSYFSTDMADDSALGVMLVDFVPTVDQKFPRVTNGEIYALVEEDLNFARTNIINQTPAAGYKYVTKSMIDALTARMYLYRKNYTLAKQFAQSVVNNSGLTLSTPLVYRRIWADLEGGETIFAISRPIENTWENIAGTWYFNTTEATGGAFFDMSRNLYNLYRGNPAVPATDVRAIAFVDATAVLNPDYATADNYLTTDIIPINKYPGKGNTPLRNDLKVFRMSEMYFILAECAAGEGDLATVATLLKTVRDARFSVAQPLPNYANATAAWADILLERRKELSYEGFRYIDIKRIGTLANQSIDRHPTDEIIKTLPTTLSNTDYRFTLPIPQDEISASGSIIVQNPNY